MSVGLACRHPASCLCLHLYRQTLNSRAAAAESWAAIAASVDACHRRCPRRVDRHCRRHHICRHAQWRARAGRTIVDTLGDAQTACVLASVTITEKVAMPAVFDLMMRPGSATTFSNFDLLPVSVPTPSGYPEGAVIRTDRAGVALPLDIVARHLDVFAMPSQGTADHRNGVRLVWLSPKPTGRATASSAKRLSRAQARSGV